MRMKLDQSLQANLTWLAKLLRRRFGPDLAEDLLQETHLRAAAAKASEVRHPRAYLLQIATNVARDQLRRQAVRGGGAAVSIDDAYDSAELSLASDQEETLLLKQVILSMPVLYREAFLLSRFHSMTYAEIATYLAISSKTVEWRVARALEHCSRQLRR